MNLTVENESATTAEAVVVLRERLPASKVARAEELVAEHRDQIQNK